MSSIEAGLVQRREVFADEPVIETQESDLVPRVAHDRAMYHAPTPIIDMPAIMSAISVNSPDGESKAIKIGAFALIGGAIITAILLSYPILTPLIICFIAGVALYFGGLIVWSLFGDL